MSKQVPIKKKSWLTFIVSFIVILLLGLETWLYSAGMALWGP